MAKTFFKARGGRLVEADSSSPEEFIRAVRLALGRPPGAPLGPVPEATPYSQDPAAVEARAQSVIRDVEERADELTAQLEESATDAGWTVTRSDTPEEAARYILTLARELEARAVVRSAHPVLDRLQLEEPMAEAGIGLRVMAIDEAARESADEPARTDLDEGRLSLRRAALQADLGVTGVDYGIAETGSCVLLARKGVSRLVSLVPPAHVAVVERGQVLPSLDELFTLRRHEFLTGDLGSYMNIISGPSRSADIEQTIVKGVHGPGRVYMVLLG